MAANQFFPFATGAGALVLTNSQLQAMTALAIGFQQGVADPASVNSVWRQSASIAAMIAQFTADNQPNAVLDDGNIATLEAEFEAALKIFLQSAAVFVPVVPATTWYVDATNGTDDANHGLSSGTGAFRSGQYAVNYISSFFSSSQVTVNFAAGTYAGFSINSTDGGLTFSQSLISAWKIIGAAASTTFITQTSTTTNLGRGFQIFGHANVTFTGFTVEAYYECIISNIQSTLTVYNCNIVGYGATSSGFAAYYGSTLSIENNSTIGATSSTCSISGTFGTVFNVISGGSILVGYQDVTRSFTSNFIFGTTTVSATASVSTGGSVVFVNGFVSFTGSTPTGLRYSVGSGGGIDVEGAGYALIPGSINPASPSSGSPGVTNTGGYYAP